MMVSSKSPMSWMTVLHAIESSFIHPAYCVKKVFGFSYNKNIVIESRRNSFKSRKHGRFVAFNVFDDGSNEGKSDRVSLTPGHDICSLTLDLTKIEDSSSLAGVKYSLVQKGLHLLYPPNDVESRNALSRYDGYWAYINRGEEPPKELTYGEFDFFFFAHLLDRARKFFHPQEETGSAQKDWRGRVFTDIGSGTGRLVIGAAALHSGWRLCRGVEILEKLHDLAVENVEKCRVDSEGEQPRQQGYQLYLPFRDIQKENLHKQVSYCCRLPLAPIELKCGSFEDPYEYIGDSDCVFVFSTCMSASTMQKLGNAIGLQCRPGTIVITTDVLLPLEGDVPPLEDDESMPWGHYKFKLLEKLDGHCELVGGICTAFMYQVVESLWEDGVGKRLKPVLSKEAEAYKLVKLMEAGKLTDTKQFLRNVYNNMAFHNYPEDLRPKLDE